MKKLLSTLSVCLLLGCQQFKEDPFIVVKVDNALGGSYSYELALDGETVEEGRTDADSGSHDVSISVFDIDGLYCGGENKSIVLDECEKVTFYLYYAAPVEIVVRWTE